MRSIVIAGWMAFVFGTATPTARLSAEETVDAQEVVAASAKGEDDKTPVYLLRYRFRAGEKLHYRVKQETTIKATAGGASGVDRNASTTRKHLRVVSVDKNGHAVLEPIIDAVKMWKQHNEGTKYEYDSDDRTKPPRHFAGVAKTIGVPLVRVTVSPRGELIKAVPILDKKVQKQVVKNDGPRKDASDASKNFLVVLPEKPVRVGEKWTDDKLTVRLNVDRTLNLWRDYTILRKYKLLSVVDGKATISLDMVPKKRIVQPNLRVQIVQRLLAGKIVFDVVRGEIVSRDWNVDEKVFGFTPNGKGLLHVVSKRHETIVRKPAVASGNASKKD